MAESIRKWSYDKSTDRGKLFSSVNQKLATDKTQHEKKVNSWDCSTPSDKARTPKIKSNDWDSSDECQETMVEPFNDDLNLKDNDNWDSESDENEVKQSKDLEDLNNLLTSLDSYELSNPEFSDLEKNSQVESMEKDQKDELLLEDFEEFIKEDANKTKENSVRSLSSDGQKGQSIQSEGTPEDTIWMIPKSERTQSGESTSKLISSSDKQRLDKLKFEYFVKKTKSLSDVEKHKVKKPVRSSRSDYLNSDIQKLSSLTKKSDFPIKLEMETSKTNENILGVENFDRTSVFFTEYECRAITLEKGLGKKRSASSRVSSKDILTEVPNNESASVEKNEQQEPGPSKLDSPNLSQLSQKTSRTGSKSVEEDKEEDKPEEGSKAQTNISESWYLLDNKGQCQTIPETEISILLNGRSADAVLQGRKQHFVQCDELKDSMSLKNLVTNIAIKESSENISKADDVGGEDERRRLVDLERKMENTLFYIQPGINLTASIRIIPVDNEMIHIWRRARDCGSVLSSEIDLLDVNRESLDSGIHRLAADVDVPSAQDLEPQVQNPSKNDISSQSNVSTVAPIKPLESTTTESPQNHSTDYSALLLETRTIVDNLTNNFKNLQTRLDGETNRSMALQIELNKLRLMMKGKLEKNSRETIHEMSSHGSSLNMSSSIMTLKASDKVDIRSESIIEEACEEESDAGVLKFQDEATITDLINSEFNQSPFNMDKEDNDIITVNIYTMDTATSSASAALDQETYSVVQSNLGIIEKKMKRLQQENEIITAQNAELRKKLKEISQELEKYLSGTAETEPCIEEGKELETLRDQVCNLKLELENFTIQSQQREQKLSEENSLIQDEFTKSLLSLKDWTTMGREVFQKLETISSELQCIGLTLDINLNSEACHDPFMLSNILICYIEKTTQYLLLAKDNSHESTLTKEKGDFSGLDQVISGYSELIEQCRRGQITNETKNKVMEDFFTIIVEKASLVEEIKMLKTENEMLLESQLEHYEKLKQTMIALKDRKSEISALKFSQKLCYEEKTKMSEVLKVYESEKTKLEEEMTEKMRSNQDLLDEVKRKELEVRDFEKKLKEAISDVRSLEKSCRCKDDAINELKMENEELLTTHGMKNDEIRSLKEKIQNFEIEQSQLEAELSFSKLQKNESQKEMTNYISHLEALVNSLQDSIDKTKQKVKENNQIITRLKSENEVLEKQHQCDVKLFNNTKDDLDSCSEKLQKSTNKQREMEEEFEKLQKKYESLAVVDKEKTEGLEMLAREYKVLKEENEELNRKVAILSKDKDDLLKEQKELINKYSGLSKEIQKLQEKYRSVKTECNERTDLIRYLELMLKENLIEYNNRIIVLEQNITRIIEKIITFKNELREKSSFDDGEVKELRQQLQITYKERKELQDVVSNYYMLMQRLENEVHDREKKVNELNVKLSLEQEKYENVKNCKEILEVPEQDNEPKIEKLERELAMATSELSECKKELQSCQTQSENERKKMELIIADLRSEVKKYQLRLEVMMRNLTNSNKQFSNFSPEKRNPDEEFQGMKKEIQQKCKIIEALQEAINKYQSELRLKETELDNLKKKNHYQEEELKNLQNELSKAEDIVHVLKENNEVFQREKDEMAQKLFQSLQVIMEERSAKQSLETQATDVERNLRNELDQLKNEFALKVKEFNSTSEMLEDKKKLVSNLQEELKRMKSDITYFKSQVNKKKRSCNNGSGDGETHQCQNVSLERLESCLNELKDVRNVNLELRKTEGQYQAKIVRLEDEIRDARLLIKELQGDIKTEKKSKKALKNIIVAARMEIEKCLMTKQLMSVVAERINRHLDLSDIPSREMLSGFRLSDSSTASK